MNRKFEMARLALILFAALLLVSCGKPAGEAGRTPAEESPTNAAAGKGGSPFDLESIERVDSQRSNSAAGNTVYWDKGGEEGGLMMVLKLKSPDPLEYYSSDFSLGYVDETGIPRSACVGISSGVADPKDIKMTSWMLAGAMSRSWASAEKPYFGILFGVPRKVNNVTLYYAAPLMKNLELSAAGAK